MDVSHHSAPQRQSVGSTTLGRDLDRRLSDEVAARLRAIQTLGSQAWWEEFGVDPEHTLEAVVALAGWAAIHLAVVLEHGEAKAA